MCVLVMQFSIQKELKHYESSKMDAISAHSKVGIGTHTFLFDWG